MSEEVKFLEEHLKRPLFNIDEYEPDVSDEEVLKPKYRKCYRLNERGEITVLNLYYCRLSELRYLAFFSALKGLQSLNLSNTDVRDVSGLGELKGLQSLYLSHNRLRDVSGIGELKGLQSLDMSHTDVRDVSGLGELKGLRSLDLRGTGVRDVSGLAALKGLQSLYLSHNRLRDVSGLGELKDLQRLDLRGTELSDVSGLAALKGLQSLDMSHTDVRDVSGLAALKGLQRLNLSGTGVRDVSGLAALKGLRSLNLSRNGLGDVSGLVELKDLQSLDLSGTGVRDVSGLGELKGLQSLNLGGTGVSDVSGLAALKGLRRLYLSNTGVIDVSGLAALKGLQRLNLSFNELSDVSGLGELKSLQSLDLSHTDVRDVSGLGELKGLQSLDLNHTDVCDVSRLGELKGLQSLDLSGNRLSDVSGLGALKSLQSLNLSGTGVSNMSGLGELKSLQRLYLSNTGVSDVSAIHSLKKLRTVDLSETAIKELEADILDIGLELEEGDEFGGLPGSIKLYGNDLQTPPMEIIKRGHQEVVDYFQSGQKKAINEFKLVLVGDGGAGKTTLVKRLRGEDIPEREAKTDGINIQEWTVPDTDIQAHIWDFGGQEIMHATHQFFLSKRSLYVLVLDGRKEEEAEYWLDLIKSFGGDSPVIIVLNKIDENPGFDINGLQLRKDYPSIKGIYRLSAKMGGDEYDQFSKSLCKAIEDVEITSTPWPVSWFKVKTKLEGLKCPFIEFADYRKTCIGEGVASASEQNTLVQFLNDLGSVVYFDGPHLELTQVLNPEWVTTGVYRILNAKSLADAKGSLVFEKLKDILKKQDDDVFEFPEEKHSFILELMCKFELCYRANEHDQSFMIPDLLDVREPEGASTDFEEGSCLNFEFDYPFLPKSLFNRFMVRKHKDIAPKMLWRTGVVMKDPYADARAIVKVNHKDRKISIQVLGEQRREYFSVLRREFLDLHDEFESLDYGQWIPLPRHPDHRVDYEDLVGREHMGEEYYISGKLRERFLIKALLDNVVSQEERKREFMKESGDRMVMYEDRSTNINITNSTTGDVVSADQIINSFNKTANSSAPDEVKQRMAELKDAMPGLLDSLEAKDQKKLGKRVETLNDEISSEETDVSLCEFVLEDIKKVAIEVGSQGLKVIDITTKLLPLLQGLS